MDVKNWKNIENDRVLFRRSMYLTIRSINHYSQIFIYFFFFSKFQSCLDYNNGKDIHIYTRYFSSHLSIVFYFYLIFVPSNGCRIFILYIRFVARYLSSKHLYGQSFAIATMPCCFILINKISCMIYFNSDICTSSWFLFSCFCFCLFVVVVVIIIVVVLVVVCDFD